MNIDTDTDPGVVADPWAYIPSHLRTRYDLECRSIPNALRRTAREYPDGLALVAEDGRQTFARLEQEMLRAVRAVQALGIRPGDRVAIWAPNCGRWILAALGALGAGAILVPLNTRFKGEEAAYVLRKSGARLLFVAESFLDNDYIGMLRAADSEAEVLRPEGTVLLSGDAGEGELTWTDFLDRAERTPLADAVAAIDALGPDTVSDIMFTSGTTGHPKGVVLTHGQSLRAHGGYAQLLDFRRGDRYLIIPPFFHCFGYKMGWMACLVHGVAILPQATFDTVEVMRRVQEEKVSILFGPPTVFQAIMESSRRAEFDLTSIRSVMPASTIIHRELVERMIEDLRPELIVIGYGLTESTAFVTTTLPGDGPDRVAGTVGRPGLDIEVRLVDVDGREVGPDTEGELQVRGYAVTSGYWQEPEQTAAAIDADGWLRTGDIAVRDSDGYYRITDRLKDMILVGGFNVYPAEVERILSGHPAIEHIAVVGVPDERLGEVPLAFVVVREGAELTEADFLAWARERIANFKCPRRMIGVSELPRNAGMKVLKNVLRTQAAELI